MSEPPQTYLLLCVAALAAGVINSLAGGGTLLTFPALGRYISDLAANVTNTVALVPGSLAGAWGYHRELWASRRWVLLLIGPSLAGGLAGSLLLTQFPEEYFEKVVPWLILGATLLFIAQPSLSRWAILRTHAAAPSTLGLALMAVFQFFVAIYGGYFGAGMGILMLSTLGLMGVSDIHKMNAVKSFLAACINGISVAVFIIDGRVAWRFAAPMAVCAVAGGYVGARIARRLNRNLVRWIVVAIGLGLSVYYFLAKYGHA
jgi:uncharacterized membrane protein YfcA